MQSSGHARAQMLQATHTISSAFSSHGRAAGGAAAGARPADGTDTSWMPRRALVRLRKAINKNRMHSMVTPMAMANGQKPNVMYTAVRIRLTNDAGSSTFQARSI